MVCFPKASIHYVTVSLRTRLMPEKNANFLKGAKSNFLGVSRLHSGRGRCKSVAPLNQQTRLFFPAAAHEPRV